MSEWDEMRAGELQKAAPARSGSDSKKSETADLDGATYPHVTRILGLSPADFRKEIDGITRVARELSERAPKASRALQVMAQILGEMYRNKL